MFYMDFMQTSYCHRALQPKLDDVTERLTYSELLVPHCESAVCLWVLIYFIAKVVGNTLKCIFKKTPPGSFQVEAFAELSANISPGAKVCQQSRTSVCVRLQCRVLLWRSEVLRRLRKDVRDTMVQEREISVFWH